MFAGILFIIMLEASDAAGMEQGMSSNNLSVSHVIGFVAMPLFCL